MYAAQIPGDFRANVALGASVDPYPVTPGIRAIAADIYEQTGLDFLGIDLLLAEKNLIFAKSTLCRDWKALKKPPVLMLRQKLWKQYDRTLHKELISYLYLHSVRKYTILSYR